MYVLTKHGDDEACYVKATVTFDDERVSGNVETISADGHQLVFSFPTAVTAFEEEVRDRRRISQSDPYGIAATVWGRHPHRVEERVEWTTPQGNPKLHQNELRVDVRPLLRRLNVGWTAGRTRPEESRNPSRTDVWLWCNHLRTVARPNRRSALRSTMLRDYLYISDVKLDMYYEQIPTSARDKIAVDLKIDLKIVSATIKEQPLKESRYQKLRLVEQYLSDNEKVGSIKEPAKWFAGTEDMKYGPISSGSKERGDLVLFGAKLGTSYRGDPNFECCLGLVGSENHMVRSKERPQVKEYATSSFALGMVAQHLGQALAHKLDDPDLDDPDNESQGRHRDFDTLDVVIKSVGNVENLKVPPEKLEFLARRLTAGEHMWNGKTRWVVFGTPLYVAKAD